MDDHIEQYRRYGYAVARGVFSKGEVAELAGAFDRIYEKSLQLEASFRDGNYFVQLAKDAALGRIVRLIKWPAYKDSGLRQIPSRSAPASDRRALDRPRRQADHQSASLEAARSRRREFRMAPGLDVPKARIMLSRSRRLLRADRHRRRSAHAGKWSDARRADKPEARQAGFRPERPDAAGGRRVQRRARAAQRGTERGHRRSDPGAWRLALWAVHAARLRAEPDAR